MVSCRYSTAVKTSKNDIASIKRIIVTPTIKHMNEKHRPIPGRKMFMASLSLLTVQAKRQVKARTYTCSSYLVDYSSALI